MRLFDAGQVERALDFARLIDALDDAFRKDVAAPLRHHHPIPVPGAATGTLLLMPAWVVGEQLGIKLVTVFPDNARVGLPSVLASYLVLSATTGAPLAMLDGRMLTVRRTAAASALAARYLARADAAHLVMVGTGTLAPALIRAHATVRPLRRVTIWGRTPEKARALAASFAGASFAAAATEDLAGAVGAADMVSCATLSHEPLVLGSWLKPGAHVDLVGGFTPAMREADDAAVRRAEVFVDTREGATREAGDIIQALASGALAAHDGPGGIRADLFELARGRASGRSGAAAITLFKSVGSALEDLAAAQLVLKTV